MRGLLALIALSGCDSVWGLDSVNPKTGVPVFVRANGVAVGDGDPVKTIDVPLPNVTEGELIVVAICGDAGNAPSDVSDDDHAQYADLPIGAATPGLQSYVYWSRVTKTRSSFSVRVTFAAEGGYSPDVRIAEYANIAVLSPVENAMVQEGDDTDMVSLVIDVPVVPALVFASSCVGSGAKDVTGFTTRFFTSPNSDLIADQIVTTVGPLAVTAKQTVISGLILQLVAFEGGPLP